MFRTKRVRLAVTVAAADVLGTDVTLAIDQVAPSYHDPPPAPPGAPEDATDAGTFLAAVLEERDKVPVADGPAVNDRDGQAIEILLIMGNEVPSGAVRGQLHRLANPVDLTAVLFSDPLPSPLSGDRKICDQQVPAPDGPTVAEPDERATAFVGPDDGELYYSFAWSGTATPTAKSHSEVTPAAELDAALDPEDGPVAELDLEVRPTDDPPGLPATIDVIYQPDYVFIFIPAE
jgi:hypothetical protein